MWQNFKLMDGCQVVSTWVLKIKNVGSNPNSKRLMHNKSISLENLLVLSSVLFTQIALLNIFFFKNGPITASFCLFSFFSNYNNINWKKHWWCAWDSNLRPQDGRCRWNHGAMAATQHLYERKNSIRHCD